MGNTQTNNSAPTHEPQTPTNGAGGGTLKSRRGSRVKVFARFSQRRQAQQQSASKEAIVATPTSTSAYDDSIEEELLMLRQSHASVIRQLEDEQMDFRKFVAFILLFVVKQFGITFLSFLLAFLLLLYMVYILKS